MMDEIDVDTKQYLNNVIETFSPGIKYACAYGSGVFKQRGHKNMKDNMIDFIFVVDDSFTWHQQNLLRHLGHYSFLGRFGARFISSFQKNYGAAAYCNTRIELNERLIKYNVIELEDFMRDLINWDNLYIAGRLHKPVVCLKGLDDEISQDAIRSNLVSASNTSLLSLPEKFSEEEFYTRIASLSYTGDFRMIIGEDKEKVKNIVRPNMEKFRFLYQDVLEENVNVNRGKDFFEQDVSVDVQSSYIRNLPSNLQYLFFRQYRHCPGKCLADELSTIVKDGTVCRNNVLKGVSKIVQKSSISQSLKNIPTSGVSKSIFYAAGKILKMVKGFAK